MRVSFNCLLASECSGCPISVLMTPSLLAFSQFPLLGHEITLSASVTISFTWLEAESSHHTMDFEMGFSVQVCISFTLIIARTLLFLETLALYYQRGVPGLIYIVLRPMDICQSVVNEYCSELGVGSKLTSHQLCCCWGNFNIQILATMAIYEKTSGFSSNLSCSRLPVPDEFLVISKDARLSSFRILYLDSEVICAPRLR